MSKTFLFKIAIGLAAGTIFITLAAVWSWALFGMSSSVGGAWTVTVMIMAFVSFITFATADLKGR